MPAMCFLRCSDNTVVHEYWAQNIRYTMIPHMENSAIRLFATQKIAHIQSQGTDFFHFLSVFEIGMMIFHQIMMRLIKMIVLFHGSYICHMLYYLSVTTMEIAVIIPVVRTRDLARRTSFVKTGRRDRKFLFPLSIYFSRLYTLE